MYNPFDLSDAVIRQLPHVEVTRLAPVNGRRCQYRKVFKADGLRNADYWMRRENDFLLDFDLKKLHHTVELSNYSQISDGQHTPIVESVITNDAGITIEDWLRVRPHYANGATLDHPFQHTGQFLLLIRACLQALKEIHRIGIVHCDIKTDNICLPFAPYPTAFS
jgi:serine/threonine protein kinase